MRIPLPCSSLLPSARLTTRSLARSLARPGFLWLLNSIAFFAGAILVGIVCFSASALARTRSLAGVRLTLLPALLLPSRAEDDFATQRAKSETYLGGTPW